MATAATQQASPYIIKGQIVSDKKPVKKIEIRITDRNGSELGNASTDDNGAFSIENIEGNNIVIMAVGEGYAPISLGIATGDEDTDLGTLELERITDLEEVTITARNRTDMPGKTIVYVSRLEKERAESPLNMLTILSYKAPRINVRESERTLTIDGEEPQILVNGIKRPMSFISSINPESIEKIEFSSEPDVRFGKRYLNIITRRPPEGGWFMVDVTGAVTTPRNFFSGVAEYTRGKNDFMLYYDGGYRHGRREYIDEEERYVGGGRDITFGAEGMPSSTLDKYHSLYFNFTSVPSEKSMFVATASMNLHDNNRERLAHVTELAQTYDRTNRRGYSQANPMISLYYYLHPSKNATIEITAAGSYNDASSYRNLSYSSGYASNMSTESLSWHYSAEALWKQRLPFATLVTGASYTHSDNSNRYTIDGIFTRQPLSSTFMTAYTSLAGNILTVLYNISAGVTYYKAKEGIASPDLMISLQKNIGSNLSLSYNFRFNPGMPSLSDYNNVPTPVNELMYHIGTNNIEREKNINNQIQVRYNKDNFYLSLQGAINTTSHPFVTNYLYQNDSDKPLYGYFLEIPGNGIRFTRYGFVLNAGVSNLWDFLSLGISTGWGHNRLKAAEAFTACAWHLNIGMGMYWKGWQLNIAGENLVPSWSMWGGNKIVRRWPYTSLTVYKKLKNWNFHASWTNLFSRHGGRYRTETLTSVAPRSFDFRMNDQGNLFEIGVRFQFTMGKLLSKKNRTLNTNGNGENGVRWDY